MLVKVEPVEFALFRNTQSSRKVNRIHHCKRDTKRSQGDGGTANELSFKESQSAAVEKSGEGRRVIG